MIDELKQTNVQLWKSQLEFFKNNPDIKRSVVIRQLIDDYIKIKKKEDIDKRNKELEGKTMYSIMMKSHIDPYAKLDNDDAVL